MLSDLGSYLNWIVYSGGALLIVSWVLDRFPGFSILQPRTKLLINLGVSVVLACGCYAAIIYVPGDIMKMLDPWFKIVAGIVAVYTGQQAAHKLTK